MKAKTSSPTQGTVLIVLAAILWGTTGTSQALAPNNATPLSIGGIRLIIGGSALLTLALSQGNLRWHNDWLRWQTFVAGLSTALYQLTFFAGVALTGVALGTIVAIGSAPIFAGMLAYFIERERLQSRWFIATALAILGSILLIFSGNETLQINPLGILLSLGAGLSYAVFTLANKQLVQHFAPDAVMAVSFCTGAIVLSPLLFLTDLSWVLTTNGSLVALHLGLLATGLAYALFGRGIRTVPISTTSTLSLAEPLTATTLGIVLLGEQLTSQAFIGIAILFLGLIVLVIPSRTK